MSSTRQRLEGAVVPRASSIDGRRFTFQRSLEGLDLEPGGYVIVGGDTLGQVHELEQGWVEGPELAAAIGEDGTAHPGVRIALALGSGILLDAGRTFHDDPFERADEATVSAWLERVRPSGRAALDVGALLVEPGLRFSLDAGGFDRHTFLCGQSGSGKTYALGTILERLLLETSLRIVVLDPNSDFVRLGECRDDVSAETATRYADAAAGLAVRRSGERGQPRLHVRFTDCDADEQAAVLRLDPIRDREEFGTLLDGLDSGLTAWGDDAREVAARLRADPAEHRQALGTRIRNLGIERWSIWSSGELGSLQDLVGPDGPRALVVDLGSLETHGEMAIAAESVLAALWRRRADREPVLVVVDEAHNVCPQEPGDAVTALGTEHAVRIAAEGRKFGIYFLVSTQRPQRVHDLVLSQCDNLVLMRMNSSGDLAHVASRLSFAPEALLERALSFGLGESLVTGKIASHPALVKFGPRIALEGGGDIPATWAQR